MGGCGSYGAAGAAAGRRAGLPQLAPSRAACGRSGRDGMMAPLDHNGAADPLHQAWDNAETIKPPDILDQFIDPTTLYGIEPPDREWVVQDWLPVGSVTSLYGGAGYGKTLLAQQLQT